PCVVGVSEIDELRRGQTVLVDGTRGTVKIEPDPDHARKLQTLAQQEAEEAARWRGHGATSDGVQVDLLANVQDGEGAREAAQGVAVGVGLFRTELAFLNAPTEPSIDQQASTYREVIDSFNGHRVVVRTLDAGSDKPMPFLHYEGEDNPALGVRGLRVACASPEILDRQLEAIAQASCHTSPPWVMAPMVSTRAEARFFAEKVRAHGLVPGVMVEVPAAALRCREILEEVDFLSIGTNDLSQYTMAADRLSPDLASLCDPWQPAVLELVRMIAQAGAQASKPVGVCGEAAADPLLAIVLVGLGVGSLSAAPQALPAVGAALSKVDFATCERAAHEALTASDGAQARNLAREVVYP
ncbi:MAG TPA: putative PEP-binding protein, partial [Beutenbergiaceae bacterium]|nr:putative PEP-binding protein [Beutenbergiaceae bacterium]